MGEPLDPVDPDRVDPTGPAASGGPAAPGRRESSEPPAVASARTGSSFWRGLREITIIVVTALVISAVVRTFLLQAFWVPSGSMEETLTRGDRILVWKPGGEPGRGDVVVFRDPADWLDDPVPRPGLAGVLTRAAEFVGVLPSTTGDDLVKRVIGVGGDTIECCSADGRIIRNGQPIDEPYIYPGSPTDQVEFRVTVPEGRLFVMGDHRGDSADSRFHLDEDDGTVPVDNVVGTAEVIMWPPSRWASLPSYGGGQPAAAGDAQSSGSAGAR